MDIILMQQTVQQTLCCTIGIMDVRHVNPLHLFPKTIIRAEGLVRLVMSPFFWWRTHDFLSKILCWPFYWHPPLFFCQSNHSIPFCRFHFSQAVFSQVFCLANKVLGSKSKYVYPFHWIQPTWLFQISAQCPVCFRLMASSIIDQSLLASCH